MNVIWVNDEIYRAHVKESIDKVIAGDIVRLLAKAYKKKNSRVNHVVKVNVEYT